MVTPVCRRVVLYLFTQAGLVEGRDFSVHDARFYRRALWGGSLGLGESYMDGDWSAPDLPGFFVKLCKAPILEQAQWLWSWVSPLEWLRCFFSWFCNLQSLEGAKKVGREHYDLDHHMYEQMLGTPMQYSCAYWKGVDTLEAAQRQKMDLLARKLKLRPGMRVLDIGCGWGDLAIFLAKEYQCKVIGLTISQQQRTFAANRAEAQGVGDRVTYLLEDYRQHKGSYDRVVSVGMLEHVGWKNLTTYFRCVDRFLVSGGLAAIHSITGRTNTDTGDAWINTYIFPNSAIPSHTAWVSALRPVPLEIEDVQNLSVDYARTLQEWRKRFDLYCAGSLDTRFVRMWHYYLAVSEAQFRIRGLNLFQMILSKEKLDRYDAPR